MAIADAELAQGNDGPCGPAAGRTQWLSLDWKPPEVMAAFARAWSPPMRGK